MKLFRSPRVLLLLFVVALPAAAQLTRFKDFTKSPEYVYLATDDEKKAWKSVTTDEQAQKFVDLFWAKRNPDLKNPANDFRLMFEARVAKSDELFKLGSKRGALTERGKLFILVGPPKTMAQKAESSMDQGFASQTGGFTGTGGGTTITYQFLYEQPQLPKWADVKSLDAKFQVDNSAQTEHLIDVGAVKRLENAAVKNAIANPQLKEPPIYKTRAEAEAEAKAAAEAAAEAAKGPVLSPAVRKALEEPAGAGAEALSLFPVTYGNGATRLMVQLFVPADKGAAPDLKLGLLVRSKDGKDAARKEEPAALEKTKGDLFADRVVNVPAGEYDVTAGLFDAAGAPVLLAKGSAKVVDLPAEFSVSPLFLAYNDYEAATAKPEDPFVFFQRKFVGKGGHPLDGKTDGLLWVVRVYNPTVDAKSTINLKKTVRVIKKKSRGKIDVPQGDVEPIKVPEAKTPDQKGIVLDLAGGIADKDLALYFEPEDTVEVVITDLSSAAAEKPTKSVSATFSVTIPPKEPAPARKK